MLIPKTDWNTLTGSLLKFKLGDDVAGLPANVAAELESYRYLLNGKVTEEGENLLAQHFIRKNDTTVRALHTEKLLELAATQALLQAIWGLSNVDVEQARHALIFAGSSPDEVNKSLTHFLTLLNQFDIITYSKKLRTVKPLISPLDTDRVPSHVFIDPKRPYSNSFWIRKIIAECQGSLYWIDKYFDKSALEWLWREATAEKLSRITIISAPPTGTIEATALADYRKLVKELSHRGIQIEWRILPKSKAHRIHDRWILDDKELCFNLPSTGTIRSGQGSELLRSNNRSEVLSLFSSLLADALAV
jgi:hypothetical protein